jgi:hypothetical protein
MDQAAGNGTTTLSSRRRKQLLRAGFALSVVCLLGIGLAVEVQRSHVRHQMQTDSEVATVWLLQATHGPNHILSRGSTVQRWANAHGVHALGDYQVLSSSFNGEPNGVEFWFDYESHTSAQELECHRVGPTAFVDDLGQVYHGFLDFQGKTVGVYLPGYDHAARYLTCKVHWMPRRPAASFPVSRPMSFTVPLPPTRRTLPLASTLPSGPASVTKNGITVTVDEVHLSPARLRTLYEGQRDLMFQVHIQGGQIADDNVEMPLADTRVSGPSFVTGNMLTPRQMRRIQSQAFTYSYRSGRSGTLFFTGLPPSSDSFTITDPYGVALLSETASIVMPLQKPQNGRKASPFWTAPVNGAGRGTDCVQLHLHVQPPSSSPQAMPPSAVVFDIPVRVAPDTTP